MTIRTLGTHVWRQCQGKATRPVLVSSIARRCISGSSKLDATLSATVHRQDTALPPSPTFDASSTIIPWSDGQKSTFHNIWLRDHCRCEKCYHKITKQRLQDTFAIPKNIQPTELSANHDGLQIHWNNEEHESFFKWDWLRKHSYNPQLLKREQALTEKILWNKQIQQSPPVVDYEAVMTSDKELAKWLRNIDQYGFSFVDGVPPTPEKTEELAKRIAFIRETHYGGFWDFTANLAHGDTAYTTIELQAHTDNTYFTDPCGLQMFHLIEFDGKGGESLLVDGFYAAQILKDVHPEAYATLSRLRIPTHSAGDADVLIQPSPAVGYPILNHDPVTGELCQIRYNNDDRSTLSDLSAEDVGRFYDALGKWNEVLKNQDSEYRTQLTPGRALIFDNWRVLHGRGAFSGHRRLVGCYINHDDYASRLKVLHKSQEQIAEEI